MHISPGEYWLYLQYMALAVVMVFAFAAVYLHCTPPAELRLIREQGNVACALSFGGALVGFCLALAASIRQSVQVPDFVLWGLAAAVVLWTPLSILGFLAGLLSLFPATIWARQ